MTRLHVQPLPLLIDRLHLGQVRLALQQQLRSLRLRQPQRSQHTRPALLLLLLPCRAAAPTKATIAAAAAAAMRAPQGVRIGVHQVQNFGAPSPNRRLAQLAGAPHQQDQLAQQLGRQLRACRQATKMQARGSTVSTRETYLYSREISRRESRAADACWRCKSRNLSAPYQGWIPTSEPGLDPSFISRAGFYSRIRAGSQLSPPT